MQAQLVMMMIETSTDLAQAIEARNNRLARWKAVMTATRLSAIDAFFVAYQETSGVLMQLGVEVELKGRITRDDLDQMLRMWCGRWPPLGQTLRKHLSGLSWEGECRRQRDASERREALAEWRNRPLDPFKEPPFQVLWIADGERHLLAFRAHHAVVDGEGFFAVCAEAVRALAKPRISRMNTDQPIRIREDPWRTSRKIKIGEAIENRATHAKRSTSRIEARRLQCEVVFPATSRLSKEISRKMTSRTQRQATELGVAPGWLCASAWMKAIHAWNRSRGGDPSPLISLEVPVSLRRARDNQVRIGNLISPLTLYGDATQPLDVLAKELKQQMSKAMRQRTHLALPSLASPAKFLPYGDCFANSPQIRNLPVLRPAISRGSNSRSRSMKTSLESQPVRCKS